MITYTIGIDPGKKTGFAVFDIILQQLVRIETLNFWSAFGQVMLHDTRTVRCVAIEVPDTKHVWHKSASGLPAIQRQAVNVGGVIRESELLAEGIKNAGFRVITVHPPGKCDTTKFKKLTGWTGITNQHERDAALLCYKR